MICVSIGRSRLRHMMAEHKQLVDAGATLVEMRLDYIAGTVQIKKLLEGRPSPIIATCRREEDGGRFAGSEEDRVQILRMAIAEGVDFVDLEEDTAALIPRFGKTKRIVSYHNFEKTPDDLDAIHARLAAQDADIVKIATMANTPRDNVRMLELVKSAKQPTIGLCMGEIGTPSRILAGKFGSPFTFATFHHERALAPGQLSYQEMCEVYHYNEINANSDVYAVIADPVGHSLSPLIHNAALHEQGIDAVYLPFRVPPNNLAEFFEDAPKLGIRGVSVTIPHKETAIKFVDKMDRAVREIGALNTIVMTDEGRVGYNTDARAVLDSLAHQMHGAENEDFLRDRNALVLGSGGVARAVTYALARRGARVEICGRTQERAEELAKHFDCQTVRWSARQGTGCDILINGTPIGMHPNVDETPLAKHHLKPSMVVFDTVYNPETTLLAKEARSQGCTVVSGLDMFIRQAALQYKLFTGHNAPLDLMRETLRRAIGPARV
ncbi:MAG: shikimate dehydrogenase [Planctomycetota bacterium]|nr:MAG: shikimate dehydrogenase [Planctomycetota bacterium]REK43324.1 MAG: shikimate dehydrogenase [Planctomycetota bacterium]